MAEKSKLDAALDELLTGKSAEEIVGAGGVLKQLTKALLERAMGAELSNHLGYEKHDSVGRGSGNNRNGKSRKTVQGEFGAVEIEVRVTETAASSRRFCRNTSGASKASTTRFYRCMRGA